MKIAIFYWTDFHYLSVCVTFRSTPFEQCFTDPVVPGAVYVFPHGWWPSSPLLQGGRVLCVRSPTHFPGSQPTCESLCCAETHFAEALCRHLLVLQEPGGVWDCKSMLVFPGTGGVSLELFLFVITCLVKQGYLTPACHSLHQDSFRRPLTSTWCTHFRSSISVCGTQVWETQVEALSRIQFRVLRFLISHHSPSMCRRVRSNECSVFLLFHKAHVVSKYYGRE